MRDKTEYQIKVGDIIVKKTANQKDAKRVFHQQRARYGGKVKFFTIRNRGYREDHSWKKE